MFHETDFALDFSDETGLGEYLLDAADLDDVLYEGV